MATGTTGAPANLPYPVQGDLPDVPGDLLVLAEAISKALAPLVPTGCVIAFGGNFAPEGWALCDGTAHGSPALQKLLNSPNAPDMRDRFLIGATPKPVRTTGGNALGRVGLTLAHVPAHTHTVTSGGAQNNSHTHTFNGSAGGLAVDQMNHVHGWPGGGNPIAEPVSPARWGPPGNSQFYQGTGFASGMTTGTPGSHAHTVSFGAATSGDIDTGHEHGMTTDAQGGGALHGDLPPYYAVTFLIKK